MNKFFWLKTYILAAVIISLSFLGVNLWAAVETGSDIPGYVKNVNCPNFAAPDKNSLTMKDSCTGQVWASFELPIYHGTAEPGYTWEEARDACAAFMQPGLFRLPTVEELVSLLSYKCESGICSSSLAEGIYYNPPFFANGTYWSINDFNEPASWTNANAAPVPGNEDRDYKRSVSLLTGEVDSPVYSREIRLGAWCIVDRNPEVIERKFISVIESYDPPKKTSTGGTLKTKYNRVCPPPIGQPGCEAIGASSCEGGYCTKTEAITFPAIVVACKELTSLNSPLSTTTYHIENNNCVVDNTGTDCPGTGGAKDTWKGNDYNGHHICYYANCTGSQHLDPDTLLCIDNTRACEIISGACRYSNNLCNATTRCEQDCDPLTNRCEASGEVCNDDGTCDDEPCTNWTATSVELWSGSSWGPCHVTACTYQATVANPACVCNTGGGMDIVNGVCTNCNDQQHLEDTPPTCHSNCQNGTYSTADCISGFCSEGENIGEACTAPAQCPFCVSTAGDCSTNRCRNDVTNALLSQTCTPPNPCPNDCVSNHCSLTGDYCFSTDDCPDSTCVTTDDRKMIWEGDLASGVFECTFQKCQNGFHKDSSGICVPNTIYQCTVTDPHDWVLTSRIDWTSVSGWGSCNATACYPAAVLSGTNPTICMCPLSGAASNPIIRGDLCTFCGNTILDPGEDCDAGLTPVVPLYERQADVVFLFDSSGSMSDEQAFVCSETKSVISYLLNDANFEVETNISCTGNPDCANAAEYVETEYPCVDKDSCTFLQKTNNDFKCQGSSDDPAILVCYVRPPTYCEDSVCKIRQPYFSNIDTDVLYLPGGGLYPVCSTGRLIPAAEANPQTLLTVPVPTISCNPANGKADCFGVFKSNNPALQCSGNLCSLDNSCAYNTTDDTDDAVCLPRYVRGSMCFNADIIGLADRCEVLNGAFYPNCDYYTTDYNECTAAAIAGCTAAGCTWNAGSKTCAGGTACSGYTAQYNNCAALCNGNYNCNLVGTTCTGANPRTLTGNGGESWGQGVIDIINNRRWLDGIVKVIIPSSDEGPQDGNNTYYVGIGWGWDAADYAILQQVIAVAVVKDVTISPIFTGLSSTSYNCTGWTWPVSSYNDERNIYCAIEKVASDTGGDAIYVLANASAGLKTMIQQAGTLCDDVTGDGIMDCVRPASGS